jgi:hypothetical protein
VKWKKNQLGEKIEEKKIQNSAERIKENHNEGRSG